MCAQRNKVECMLTSICCHNRFGFFCFVGTLARPAFQARRACCYGAAKNLKLHRPLRRVAPERRRASPGREFALDLEHDMQPLRMATTRVQPRILYSSTRLGFGAAAAAGFARFVISTEHVTRVRMVSFADSFFDLSAFHLSEI